jgi:hypothetical protein
MVAGETDDVVADKGTPQPGLREAGARLPTAGRAFINAAQGPMFGFADEISGAGAAAIDRFLPSALGGQRNPGMTFGDLYTRYRDVARGASESYGQERPVVSALTQAGASLPLMGVTRAIESALPAAASTAGAVRNAAIIGGGLGAVSGAGAADSVSDIPQEAARAAALGGAMSAAVPMLGAGVRAAAGNVRARSGGTTADDLARERVAAALARDGSGATQAGARLSKLGDEARVADAAGKNTRDLLDTMATAPGRTADRVETMIRNRQIGRADRITEGAAGLAGGRQLPAEIAELTRRQAEDAGPIYQAIRNIPVAADDRLQRILQRPVVQDAIAQARVAAANADDVLPDIKAGEAAPMAVWDQIKRGLDDVIGLKKRNVDVGTSTNAAKSTLADALKTKRDLVGVLDELVPDYKRARDAFSGPAALKDAMDEGRSLFAMRPTELREMLGGMSASERDAFRVGAAQALRDKVGTESGQTAVLKFWKEPATRERLQAVFPNTRTYREFEAALLAEGRLKMLEQVGRGTQTASRNARQDDEGAAALGAMADTAAALTSRTPLGALQAVRNVYGRMVVPEPVRDRIGDMLLTRGPQAQTLLGDLSRFVDAENARRSTAAARAGLLGGVSITSLLD